MARRRPGLCRAGSGDAAAVSGDAAQTVRRPHHGRQQACCRPDTHRRRTPSGRHAVCGHCDADQLPGRRQRRPSDLVAGRPGPGRRRCRERGGPGGRGPIRRPPACSRFAFCWPCYPGATSTPPPPTPCSMAPATA
ncbi:hypothetical protein G6F24_016841 [Rhizopus arrhizus]|nr:hypothetical protein G6F24_016841 [Rhizopus arrhizus]